MYDSPFWTRARMEPGTYAGYYVIGSLALGLGTRTLLATRLHRGLLKQGLAMGALMGVAGAGLIYAHYNATSTLRKEEVEDTRDLERLNWKYGIEVDSEDQNTWRWK